MFITSPSSTCCQGYVFHKCASDLCLICHLAFFDTLQAKATPPELASLKEEGNKAFAMKEYEKAMQCWDKAISLLPSGDVDSAVLHNNKAACHLMFKRYKEAVNECSAALNANPNYFKALTRRAKAYEQMGQYKAALSDLTKANKQDAANSDSKDAEKRVRDLAAGKKPSGLGGANGLTRKAPVAGGVKQQAGRGQLLFPAKISLDDDVRSMQLPTNTTYISLFEAARQFFPNAGPFVIKYLDK